MAVTINENRNDQQTDPRPVKFNTGSYVIKSDNTAYYSTDGGSTWYTITSEFLVFIKKQELFISKQNGSGTVTVTELPRNSSAFK